MEQNASVFLKVRTGDRLTPRVFRVERSGPQDDILAIERAITLADRHCRLPGVVPDGREAIGFAIEAGDTRAGALRAVRIEEGEIRLQKMTVLDHVLLARTFRYDRLTVFREERLYYVPIARKLREKLLTCAGCVWWFVFFVGLLRECRRGDDQRCENPFLHGTRS